MLERVESWCGYPPQAIRLDSGPELLAESFITWCAMHSIGLRYIQLGKPVQNAFVEQFNRTFHTEVLSAALPTR